MNKWILALVLFGAPVAGAQANQCDYNPPAIAAHVHKPLDSQRLVLAGPNKLELGLVEPPATLAHSGEMLIAKYANGSMLSSRQLTEEEMRFGFDSELALPDFVRLVFLKKAPSASAQDTREAQSIREAMRLGCSNPSHLQIDDIDVFTFAQTRQNGERYHAYYILDGDIVHYIDISGTDAFAERIFSTLRKRN